MLIFHVQISYYRKECTCDDTRHDRKAIRLFLISELLQVRLEVLSWLTNFDLCLTTLDAADTIVNIIYDSIRIL